MLSDPSRSVYLVLIVAVIVTAGVWLSRRKRPAGIAFGIATLLLILVTLTDRLIESPREEAVRRVEAMAAAAMAGQPDAFLTHVSTNFNKNGRTRENVRTSEVWRIIGQYHPKIKVWDFSRDEFQMIGDAELELGFMVKGEADSGFILRYARARFLQDADGAWRLKTIAFFNPAENGMKTEDPIPGFP